MKIIILFLFVAFLPFSADAQNGQGAASDFEGLPIPSWGIAIIDSFDKPVHPVVGGVVSGGGLGVGIGYTSPDDQKLYRNAEALVSLRRYWILEGEVGRRSENKRSQIGVFAVARNMNRLDYFGIGPDTVEDDRSDFRLRDTAFGTRGWYSPVAPLRLGGSASIYVPDLGPGSNDSVPSIEDAFPVSTIPGGFSQPVFRRYRGIAELVYPFISDPELAAESDSYRGAYQVAVEAAQDADDGRHDFHRWEAGVQQRFPGFKSGQRLTLNGFIASTNTDADVPFFMLYTLGGSGGLKAFRPDLLGSDGTRATLRGFRNYRFRDRDLVLMQAEYRIPLYKNIHSTVFVDSGQVAPHVSDLFDDIRTSTGFSLSYVSKGRAIGRLDVGCCGGEGVQVFFNVGMFQN